ncbi:MAG: PVC-type heme-binding CxxCH protein [Verrucomicrobiota bacterium]
MPNNKFLWSDVEMGDFYFSLDVRMPNDNRNAGIQFRSKPTDTPNLQAVGYQADAGKNVWGRLYHEHGRGKLDWTDRGEKVVKRGEWNRYEILAVGNRIWTAINGQLSVAIHEQAGGEDRGQIALQIHSGQAQTVEYRINQLVHDPKVELAGMNEAALNAAADAKTLKRKPNFVIIFTDDQGYGDLGCFGSETIKTPHIDRMAKEGRKFTNFVVPQSICTPSRAALLTGSYAKRTSMHQWVLLPQSNKGLHPNEHTIADQLKSQGYATTCIGKWHLGHHEETLPHRNGFDSFYGIPYSNDMNHPDNSGKPKMGVEGLDIQWKDPESTLTMWKTPLMHNDEIIELPVDQRTITRRYTDKTIEFIKQNQSKPFFVYLPHSMPHVPLYVPDDFHDPDPKQAYIKTMEHIDAEVGRVLDTLRELKLVEHTYVIFTSDNGPAVGNRHHGGSTGSLRGGKTSTFEGGTRVPCVVWGPGHIPADTTSDELWSTIDVLPTIASLADSELPNNRKIDGVDVSQLLTNADAKSPRREILYFDGHGNLEGIRKDHWKLLKKRNQTMLFDLSKDVIEQQNRADANPDVVKELAEQMKALGDEVDQNTRPAWVKSMDLPPAPKLLTFDDAKETLPNIVDSKSARIVPSRVGGQALQLDGRQPRMELSPTLNWQMDKKPFTVSAWVKPDSLRQAGILCCGGYSWRHGWLLDIHPDGSVRFETSNRQNQSNGSVRTKSGAVKVGQWTHVAVAVHSNKWADVFVDGELVAKDQLKGIDLANPQAKLVIGGIENSTNHNFHGTIDQVQCIAGNAQSPPEIAEYYQPIRSKLNNVVAMGAVKRFGSDDSKFDSPTHPFRNGKFSVEPNERIVFMGQTDTVRSRLDGTLESIIAANFANQKPLLRNMAWESDTVYEQWRDIDFGSWSDQLNAVGATMVMAQFGQMEALDGAERLPEFVAAYEMLLDQVASRTRRLVLVSPRPFEKPVSPYMPDHREKNSVVAQYRDAIQKLAERRSAIFVDLFEPNKDSKTRLTTNGIHLNDEHQLTIALQIASALGLPTTAPSSDLQNAIREKNRLWYDNWRPMNWSFAFGDRTTQMFSKAGGNRPPLKVELEEFKQLLQKADDAVHQVALGNPVKTHPAPVMQPAPAPPGDHSVEAQLASFKVLDGFEINLFASEADGIVKPVQMRWDDRGRLWVICIPTYPHVEPGLRPGDYIMVCEDTDGDGKADKFDRFAEGLFIPMGLEFGDGGLYVTEATELVHLKDTDGDGKADQRTVILSGFGTADSHQMVNGLERGPLGDLWFTQGHHAYSRVETPFGISKLEKSGVWRYRPGTGRLDGFFNQSKAGLNGQGVTHDNWGQTFHNSAAGSGVFYTSAGAVATDRTKGMWPLTPNPSRNTGIEFIGTRHLPNDMQGNVVWGGFMSNSIELRKVIDEGAGFQFEKLPDLIQSNRQEFRPVNVRGGPGGAIYVCDWYNATIGHYQASYRDPSRDRTHGRIWRITAKDRPLTQAPNLDGLGPAQLLELLRSPERLTRANAKKRLFDLPAGEVIPVVEQWLNNLDKTDQHYAHLIYESSGVFAAHEEVWPELIGQMIRMDNPRVRAIGTRLIGRWADRLENPLALLETTAADENARVRMETIVACSQVPSANAMQVAAMTLDQPRDRFINYTFGLAVHALRPLWLPALESGELNFADNPNHLSMILEQDASGDSLNLVRQLAKSEKAGNLALLVHLGNADDLKFALQVGSKHLEVLEALLEVARVHGKKPSGDLATALSQILKENKSATMPIAISLVGAWQVKALVDIVKAELSSAGSSEAVRIAAIGTIATLDPQSQPLVEKFASMGQPASVRAEAIRALASIAPAVAAARTYDLLPQISGVQSATPMVAALIQGPGRGTKLADLIRSKPLDKETLTRLQQALGLTGQTCIPLDAAIRAAQGITSSVPAEYDEQYVKDLKSLVQSAGNFARGKAAYKKAATCIGCHKIDGNGGDVGPDLTEVGSGRSVELLIESVLWPNRQIREGYMMTQITTKDDRLHVGYRLSEDSGVVSLRDIASPNVKKIARAYIKKEEDAGSAMVVGLTATLTDGEVADLIAYLSELKKK